MSISLPLTQHGLIVPGTRISVLKLTNISVENGTAQFVHGGIAYDVARTARKGRNVKHCGIWKITEDYETA